MTLISVIVAILAVSPSIEPSAPLPNCDFSKTSKVYFSSATTTDTVTVKVKGYPCHAGEYSIRIVSASGKEVYSYKQSFKTLTSQQWNDPDIVDTAKRFVENTVTRGFERKTGIPPVS